MVINWVNHKSTLSILNMESWCNNITKLKDSFLSMVILHIYREHNERAYCLSKEALSLAPGHLIFTKFYDDKIIEERICSSFRVFIWNWTPFLVALLHYLSFITD